jgi:hypothetical protein
VAGQPRRGVGAFYGDLVSGLRRRRLPALAAMAVVAVGVAACAARGPSPAPCSAGWATVDVPAGVVPLAVTASGSTVLVGGSSPVDGAAPAAGKGTTVGATMAVSPPPTGNPDAAAQGDSGSRRPRLFRLDDRGLAEVPLRAQSPYGHLAQLVYLATDGSAVAAVGTATGGAHLNPRWTVWRGTLDGLTEQPQGMETFGGWNAGSLDGLTLDPAGPLLIGSWSTGSGSIATALWTTSGTNWRRDPRAAALAGTAERPAEPTGIAVLHGTVLVSGFDLDGATVTLRAALWASDREGHWRRIELPGAGADSVATGVACRAEGCWVVGRVGGTVAMWHVVDGVARPVDDLPSMTVAPLGQTPMVAASDEVVWVLVGGSDAEPAAYTGTAWLRVGSPGPRVTAVAATGRTLLAVTGSLPQTSLVRSCVPSAGS